MKTTELLDQPLVSLYIENLIVASLHRKVRPSPLLARIANTAQK